VCLCFATDGTTAQNPREGLSRGLTKATDSVNNAANAIERRCCCCRSRRSTRVQQIVEPDNAAPVSDFLACIRSPCLRHCVHGAPIGGGGARGS
jgi:hypothetical protein